MKQFRWNVMFNTSWTRFNFLYTTINSTGITRPPITDKFYRTKGATDYTTFEPTSSGRSQRLWSGGFWTINTLRRYQTIVSSFSFLPFSHSPLILIYFPPSVPSFSFPFSSTSLFPFILLLFLHVFLLHFSLLPLLLFSFSLLSSIC
jgi:hypothetical protein